MNAIIKAIEVLGIMAFALTGIYEARKKGMDIVGVYSAAMITALGGVMRDIICNEIPYVFQRTELYAMCSFVGAWAFLLVVRGTGNEVMAVVACITATFLLRMLALRYKIKLPL
jgi:uncharacterized membrane protein YeiH